MVHYIIILYIFSFFLYACGITHTIILNNVNMPKNLCLLLEMLEKEQKGNVDKVVKNNRKVEQREEEREVFWRCRDTDTEI